METNAMPSHGPGDESDGQHTEAELVVAVPGYQEWYSWAQREIGGDSVRLEAATNAAIAALKNGMNAEGAAQAARIRTSSILVDYDGGRVGLESGDFVSVGMGSADTWRCPLEQIQAVQMSPAAGNVTSLAILIRGEQSWRQFPNCQPVAVVEQLLRSLSLAAPTIDCRSATLSIPERRVILDRRLDVLMRQGYKVLYQSDVTTQVAREKRVNPLTVVILLIISIFALFIPIVIYLIWYSSRHADVRMIQVDEYGRLSEQVSRK
jgi:hypothetical protein